jgi:hypothetical protein
MSKLLMSPPDGRVLRNVRVPDNPTSGIGRSWLLQHSASPHLVLRLLVAVGDLSIKSAGSKGYIDPLILLF